MLIIDDECAPQVWVTHEDTGTRYLIRPIEPRDSQKLIKRAQAKSGGIDYVKHNGLTVDFAVVDWEGVGLAGKPAACTSENKIRHGERFARIAVFIAERAQDPGLFLEEETAGKND